MAEGYFMFLASSAERANVEAALMVGFGYSVVELSIPLRPITPSGGTPSAPSHYLASDRLNDDQHAVLTSTAETYTSLEYIMYRTLNRQDPLIITQDDWIASLGLEIAQ